MQNKLLPLLICAEFEPVTDSLAHHQSPELSGPYYLKQLRNKSFLLNTQLSTKCLPSYALTCQLKVRSDFKEIWKVKTNLF